MQNGGYIQLQHQFYEDQIAVSRCKMEGTSNYEDITKTDFRAAPFSRICNPTIESIKHL